MRRTEVVAAAVAIGVVVTGAVGCASSARTVDAKGSGDPAAMPSCPVGSPLPGHEHAAIDYVDMLRFGGREYDDFAGPANPAPKTGRVVFTVRCAAATPEDPTRGAVPVVDGGSTFVAVGTPVYEVVGTLTDCALAAMGPEGKMHVYRTHDGPGCPAH